MHRKIFVVDNCFSYIFMALIVIFQTACNQSDPTINSPTSTPETKQTLRFYNWDTYIEPSILTNFEQEFGVEIEYELYDSNEELFENISVGRQYDLIVPTNYMVSELRKLSLLHPINKNNIPNMGNIDPDFLSPLFDPGNRYCLPYQWGTMGIGYNSARVDQDIESWADFFAPEYAGRISMLDDQRLSLGVVLIILGHSPNTTNPSEIKEAADFLLEKKDSIATFAPDTGQDLLLAGDVDLAFEWSGDIFQIMEENPDIRYVIPKEGSILWVDNMCIPANAANPDLAETFMNYILDAQVGATLSNYVHYASPNKAALPFIDDQHNLAIYPSDEVRKRLFILSTIDSSASGLYEEAWQRAISTD